jgi:hypothetical protein
MSATTWCVVYNPGQDSQIVDEEGRTAYPQDFTYARRSLVTDLVHANKLIVVDTSGITADSNPAARMAHEEATTRNDAIDAEKAEMTRKEDAVKSKPAAKDSSKGTDAPNKN